MEENTARVTRDDDVPQLCWDCSNCYGGCSWSESLTPVDGWTAEMRQGVNKGGKVWVQTKTWLVIDCPEFKRDALYGGKKWV